MKDYKHKLHPFCKGCKFGAILPNLNGDNITCCNNVYINNINYWDMVRNQMQQFGEFSCSREKLWN